MVDFFKSRYIMILHSAQAILNRVYLLKDRQARLDLLENGIN
jgi:hypothetical protein